MGIFEHSVASLQFSIERFYSELLTNLAVEGTVALDVLKDNLLGPNGITRELARIRQQESLERLATRQDDSFTQLQVVDDDWRDFRKSTLSWSLDCLKFKEDPITPYFYVNRVVLHDTEDEFWSNYSSPFLIWTSPSAFNDLSTMVASKCEEFEISARFVPSNGTSEAFKKLRDGDVDLLILTGDHVRRIDPPRYVKRLGSGVVEGSEIKTLVVSNKANLSADQTFSIFKDFIDHDHHGNRINSKAFKLTQNNIHSDGKHR